jgi:hypothetical protein
MWVYCRRLLGAVALQRYVRPVYRRRLSGSTNSMQVYGRPCLAPPGEREVTCVETRL